MWQWGSSLLKLLAKKHDNWVRAQMERHENLVLEWREIFCPLFTSYSKLIRSWAFVTQSVIVPQVEIIHMYLFTALVTRVKASRNILIIIERLIISVEDRYTVITELDVLLMYLPNSRKVKRIIYQSQDDTCSPSSTTPQFFCEYTR